MLDPLPSRKLHGAHAISGVALKPLALPATTLDLPRIELPDWTPWIVQARILTLELSRSLHQIQANALAWPTILHVPQHLRLPAHQ